MYILSQELSSTPTFPNSEPWLEVSLLKGNVLSLHRSISTTDTKLICCVYVQGSLGMLQHSTQLLLAPQSVTQMMTNCITPSCFLIPRKEWVHMSHVQLYFCRNFPYAVQSSWNLVVMYINSIVHRWIFIKLSLCCTALNSESVAVILMWSNVPTAGGIEHETGPQVRDIPELKWSRW